MSHDEVNSQEEMLLPLEVILRIVTLASDADHNVAHSMALVSRAVCRATAVARWRTVVMTRMRSFFAWRLVGVLSQNQSAEFCSAKTKERFQQLRQDGGYDEQDFALAEEYLAIRERGWLSTPHCPPGDSTWSPMQLVRHFFLEFRDSDTITSARYDELIEIVCQSQQKVPGMPILKDLRVLSIGSAEMELYIETLLGLRWQQPFHPKGELTLVWHGEAFAYRKIPRWTQKLHLIGIDPTSEEAGIPMPPGLRSTRAGDPEQVADDTWDERRATHIRYDTRRFALRPATTTATRLRPYLEEVCMVDSRRGPVLSSPADYSYNGERHAAPQRGAGNSTALQQLAARQPLPALEDESIEADLLRDWCVGSFKRLHLAWEVPATPRTDAIGKEVCATAQNNDTDRWPRERMDIWTDRSGRVLAPNFKTELVEAINELYGWLPFAHDGKTDLTGNPYLFAPRGAGEFGERIVKGFNGDSAADLETISNDIVLILADRMNERFVKPAAPIVEYAVRAPSTVLKLGGEGAFTIEQRMALFLDRARGGPGAWA